MSIAEICEDCSALWEFGTAGQSRSPADDAANSPVMLREAACACRICRDMHLVFRGEAEGLNWIAHDVTKSAHEFHEVWAMQRAADSLL